MNKSNTLFLGRTEMNGALLIAGIFFAIAIVVFMFATDFASFVIFTLMFWIAALMIAIGSGVGHQ